MWKSQNQILKKHKISKNDLKYATRSFSRSIKIRSNWNKRRLNKKNYKNLILTLLIKWFEPKPSFPFTIKDIWIGLENKFEELGHVWSSTVSNTLKKDLAK